MIKLHVRVLRLTKMHDYLNIPPCIICTPCIIWFRQSISGIRQRNLFLLPFFSELEGTSHASNTGLDWCQVQLLEGLRSPIRQVFSYGIRHVFIVKTCRIPYEHPDTYTSYLQNNMEAETNSAVVESRPR